MSENLQKFIGIAVMAVIVVVGVVATNNDDSDFDRTRNAAFVKLGDIKGEVKLGGQEGEAVVKESRIESAFESKRGDVTALGGDSVASVIVGDNHFRGVGDAVGATAAAGARAPAGPDLKAAGPDSEATLPDFEAAGRT